MPRSKAGLPSCPTLYSPYTGGVVVAGYAAPAPVVVAPVRRAYYPGGVYAAPRYGYRYGSYRRW